MGGFSLGGGACEMFGEEFSHIFMTNFFDLHPQKKNPKFFRLRRKKSLGGDWGGAKTLGGKTWEKFSLGGDILNFYCKV